MQANVESELKESLSQSKRILIQTKLNSLNRNYADLLEFLLKKLEFNVIVITYSTNTREVFEELKLKRKIDVSKLHFLDMISVHLGLGTPPVENLIAIHEPDSFGDIQIYTYLTLSKVEFKNSCIVFIGLEKLIDFQNVDDVGFFLMLFADQMYKHKMPEIIFMQDTVEPIFKGIIARHANITITLSH